MMRDFTADDLMRIVREAAGDDGGALDGDVLDVPFCDLGYDSLAMFETIGRVAREWDVPLADDVVQPTLTPGELLAMVNEAIGAAVA